MKIVHTKDTMSAIYLDSVRIRHEVFVVEQGVPHEIEIDCHEPNCIHCVLYSDTLDPVATCRLLPLENKKIKVQRMAVRKKYRGQDFGRLLIEHAEIFAKDQGYTTITLGAQVSALGFYKKLGYLQENSKFIEAGIEHYPVNKCL